MPNATWDRLSNGKYRLWMAYDREVIEAIKEIDWRRRSWDAEYKTWTFDARAWAAVEEILAGCRYDLIRRGQGKGVGSPKSLA
jgi:hypothetical protein